VVDRNFNCKLSQLPAEWDDTLRSDVALKLPGDDEPTVLLCARAEVEEAGLARPNEHPIIFSDKLKKSHEFLLSRGSAPGPIQESRGTQFFEIRDPEGNVIEVCKEP
jgi:hypothetical protein